MTDEKPKQPWTPGPWALGEENCGGGSNVRAVVTESAEGAVVGWTARVVIAGVEVVSDAEANANAQLFARAPALAKALAKFVLGYDDALRRRGDRTAPVDPPVIAAARAELDLCGWRWS